MIYSPVFSSSKCSLFHNSNVFCSCIIHILYTGCAKIKKKITPAAERLKKNAQLWQRVHAHKQRSYFGTRMFSSNWILKHRVALTWRPFGLQFDLLHLNNFEDLTNLCLSHIHNRSRHSHGRSCSVIYQHFLVGRWHRRTTDGAKANTEYTQIHQIPQNRTHSLVLL